MRGFRLTFSFVGALSSILLACTSDQTSVFVPTHGSGSSGGSGGGDDGPPVNSCMSGAGAPSAMDFAGQPDCPAHTCTLAGMLGSQNVMQSYPLGTKFDPYNGGFFATFGTMGQVVLTFNGPLATGQVAEATMLTLNLPTEGPMGGKTICGNDGSRVENVLSGTEFRFLLRCIAASDGLACAGTDIGGQLYGCCAR
jgi:hypothetical protein